jgi:tRNA uridine 5-carboxymethylaminomethyl modification enzyme
MLRRPEVSYANLVGGLTSLAPDVIQQVEIAIKYAGYIERQEVDVAKFKSMEDKRIPDWIDYGLVPSLRMEARQKLGKIRPVTIGQASRISGVSPSDISLIMVWMKRGSAVRSDS